MAAKHKYRKNHYVITVGELWFWRRNGLRFSPLLPSQEKALDYYKDKPEKSDLHSAWFVLEGGVPLVHDYADRRFEYRVGFDGYSTREAAVEKAQEYYALYARDPEAWGTTKELKL